MRLDKLLSNLKYGTRSEIKKIIKDKHVRVNEKVIKTPSLHIDPQKDVIKIFNQVIKYQEFIYLMLNKPNDVISATVDPLHKTVVDLLNEQDRRYEPFPCGRLDLDTEGLIILTNDGSFAHRIMHSKKDINKKYYVEVKEKLSQKDVVLFINGLEIKDGKKEWFKTSPATLEIIDDKKATVSLNEGKFHQVKRMFLKINNEVTYLKRVQIGKLKLDDQLEFGQYRELTPSELQLLFINEK